MIIRHLSIDCAYINKVLEPITQREHGVTEFEIEAKNHGADIDLSECTLATYYGLKPDEHKVGVECRVDKDKGLIYLPLYLQMTTAEGVLKGIVELQFPEGNVRFSGVSFKVSFAPDDTKIESTDDFNVLENFVSKPTTDGVVGQVLSIDNDGNTIWRTLKEFDGDYAHLSNRPSINGVELNGDKSLEDLNIKQTYTADDIPFADGETFQQKFNNGELKGQDGVSGADGITPHIGDNGNWFIGETDTNKPSQGTNGVNGNDGVGITKSEVNTSGELVITYSNGDSTNLGKIVGKDGLDGTNGQNGLSAYEIAKNGGFIGTEEEWLKSLKGADGAKGEQGEQGIQGAQGIQGEKGDQGIQGEKGKDGADGKTPVKGTDYFTAEDKTEFTAEVAKSLEGKITNKANLVNSSNIFDFDAWAKELQKLNPPVFHGKLDELNFDEKSITITPTERDTYTNGWQLNYAKVMKISVKPNTKYLICWLTNNSSSNVVCFFNGITTNNVTIRGGKGTFVTNNDTSFITLRCGSYSNSTFKVSKIMITEKESIYLPNKVAEGVPEVANEVLTFKKTTQEVEDIKAYIGYTDDDIVGLCVDYENKTFTRLAGAVGLSQGADFDKFTMYGGRKRCNVLDDGTIVAYYGDEGYTEDGSNGQVMVFQPKFYYKVVPLKLEKNNDSSIGYHLRKGNYYVSSKPKTGFKLHPAFFDENGNAVDYILFSADEGSMFDVSAGAYVNDNVDESITYEDGDLLCSVAGKKSISGLRKGLGTKSNLEQMAQNRGSGWHLETIKATSANQLLMIIELGTMNSQTGIGQGIVSITDNKAYNCSSLTGSTAELGNSTGQATETVNEIGGTETTYNVNGKVSVTYRGVENPYGNIFKHIQGVNVWGDGSMCGGQPYVANNFTFNESKNSDNYEGVGFTLPNANGYINAMGYGKEEYDWLLLPSEIGGTSALPVGDFFYVTSDLNDYRIVLGGGSWNYGSFDGSFFGRCGYNVGSRDRSAGGRLLYVPTAKV